MEVTQRFGGRIREIRREQGISQERLAELTGLHRTYVASAERGERNVSLVNICRIAGALGCLPSALLDGVPALPAKEATPPG